MFLKLFTESLNDKKFKSDIKKDHKEKDKISKINKSDSDKTKSKNDKAKKRGE